MSAPHLDPERAHWRGRDLRDADYDALRRVGVHGIAVGWSGRNFDPLLRNVVAFRRGGRFDFAADLRGADVEAVAAYTVLARDEGGDALDVVAWHPRTARVATWLGAIGLLGLDRPCAATVDDPLIVFPEPASWLAARRGGVVVVSERLARGDLLAAGSIQAADVAHGEALETMLRKVRLPRILVPVSERVAA